MYPQKIEFRVQVDKKNGTTYSKNIERLAQLVSGAFS